MKKKLSTDFHSIVSDRRRAEKTAAALIRLGHSAGLVTLGCGLIIIAAYALGFEAVWRPLPGGPPAHPLTAILFVVGGAAVAVIRPMRTPAPAIVMLLAAAGLGISRLLEVLSGLNWLPIVTPFQATLAREAADGIAISWPWNAAAMFVLVSLAFLLRSLQHPKAGQAVAALGMAPPLVSLIGYGFGVAEFHGEMSLTTSIVGVVFSATPLLLGARTGFMRALCSPWDGGRFGRLQIGVISAVVLVGGFVLQRSGHGSEFLPIFIVVTILTVSVTSAYCAVVIERNDYLRRKAERTVAHMVRHDPLSGLYNRRFLEEQEKGLVLFARRRRFEMSVLMLDLDCFKAVNDKFGHQVGDSVIQRAAGAVKSRLRGGDIAVRYGGEEILMVLLDADLAAALIVAEDVRRLIEALDVSDLGPPSITVSIGAAQLQSSIREAITRADAALYEAKRLGRNRVVAAPASQILDLEARRLVRL